jgi:imidazoleglycerol-phosphate dehydratase
VGVGTSLEVTDASEKYRSARNALVQARYDRQVAAAALGQALGEGRGIRRFGFAAVPMDEALAQAAVDCGGRAYLVFDAPFSGPSVGGIDVTLVPHFLESVCQHAGVTLHLRAYGRNDHHLAEAVFKAFGVALRSAVALEPGDGTVPSTKGVL